jgi:hypothetical protein
MNVFVLAQQAPPANEGSAVLLVALACGLAVVALGGFLLISLLVTRLTHWRLFPLFSTIINFINGERERNKRKAERAAALRANPPPDQEAAARLAAIEARHSFDEAMARYQPPPAQAQVARQPVPPPTTPPVQAAPPADASAPPLPPGWERRPRTALDDRLARTNARRTEAEYRRTDDDIGGILDDL